MSGPIEIYQQGTYHNINPVIESVKSLLINNDSITNDQVNKYFDEQEKQLKQTYEFNKNLVTGLDKNTVETIFKTETQVLRSYKNKQKF